MVLSFGEQDNQSQMAEVLSEYDITVMELPQNYGGCPIPRMEIIYNFLRSADEWMSSDRQQNVLLMHCERAAWPVLAFMLASLLLYRKKQDGEQKTLDMIYKKAPHELLQLTSTLNPLPSQLRYLHYVSTQNAGLDWPPPDKVLVIKSVVLSSIPNLDAEGGCRPIVKILGQDPFMVADQTAKVLFSTPIRSEHVRHYKQADDETVKLDIHCNVQGDVVLECISLNTDLEHGASMFRAMFNTAFISDNVLKLELDSMDVLWDCQDQYPKEFMAEIVFSQVDAATSLLEEEKENRIEKSMRKIEPEELPAEGQYDANTGREENEVPELSGPSNTESTSTLPPMPPALSETSVQSALEGSVGSLELAEKAPYISPRYGTAVEGNGRSFSCFDLIGSLSSSSVQSQKSLLASPPSPPPPPPPPQSQGASSLNSIKEVPVDRLPHSPSPNELVSRTPRSSIVNNSSQASSILPPPAPSVAQAEQMMPSCEIS
ncbi:hypothetical protein NL676_035120 [Syzygium grande]|nr:hypothetical protein NL676_035120 [Syzygium grande]